MTSKRIIIVGAGLFGAIIGRYAQAHGHEVIWIDDRNPLAGSPPSAGLIKPSWLDGFGEAGKIGREVLESLVTPQVQSFEFLPSGAHVDVLHVNPLKLIQPPNTIYGRVLEVGNGWVKYLPLPQPGDPSFILVEGIVVVAAGVWSKDLLPVEGLEALKGTAFFFHGHTRLPRLQLWAPFKQIKVFNREGEPDMIWAGDSTGMHPKTYTALRESASLHRCQEAVEAVTGLKAVLSHKVSGYRPVIKGQKHGVFMKAYPKLFLATGGGKMGTVLAGYHAHLFNEALKAL